MSRVSKPVSIPAGVEVKENKGLVTVKGALGQMEFKLNSAIKMHQEDGTIRFEPKNTNDKNQVALTGTAKAIVSNMLTGVHSGFEKRLTLVGVGYRAQVQGNKVVLNLGFSHPVEHMLPKEVTAESPSQTELVLKSIDKQVLGQVAADIRAYRPPEPYKGKGVRYTDEHVVRKETKKK